MSNLDLSKQVGPLPLGAWVVVVGTGLGIALYRKKTTAPATDQTTTDASPYSPLDTVGSGPGGYSYVPPSTGNANTAPAITDNETWSQAATNWLIAQGMPTVVSASAISKYVSGEGGLSVQEYTLLGLALAHFGAPPSSLPAVVPPSGVPGPVIVPPPTVTTPNPTPSPATVRHYTVVKGDTLWGISKRFYGSGFLYPRIWNANRAIVPNPNLIHPGQILVIP